MENLAQMPVCAINWNAMDQHLILKTQHDLDNVPHGSSLKNKNKKQLFDNNDYNYTKTNSSPGYIRISGFKIEINTSEEHSDSLL